MYSDTGILRKDSCEIGSQADTYDEVKVKLRNNSNDFESETYSMQCTINTKEAKILGKRAKKLSDDIYIQSKNANILSNIVSEFKQGVFELIDFTYNIDYDAYEILKQAHKEINTVTVDGIGTNTTTSAIIADSAKTKSVFSEDSTLAITKSGVKNSDDTYNMTVNTTGLYIDYIDSKGNRHYQENTGNYSYTFTAEFNKKLDEISNNVINSIISTNLTDSDKEYLKKILPYMLKGVYASESSLSDSSVGYFGLTSDKVSNLEYMTTTFGNQTCSTNIGDYDTPENGADLTARMFAYWVDYYKAKDHGMSINQAIWSAWGGAGSESYTGNYASAAYQAGIAATFYKQDNDDTELFSNEMKYVTTHLTKYGVQNSSNQTQTINVTVATSGHTKV